MNFPSTKQVNLDIQSNYPSIQAGKTFWDDNGYEAVVRRFENGKRAINDFLFMVNERANIEKKYAERLDNWYVKWNAAVSQGSEFGVTQSVWQKALTEGRKMADIHHSISSKLGTTTSDGIQKKLYQFKKQHYHKVPLLSEIKEVKECREAFKNAQLPYKRALELIYKTKKKYSASAKVCARIKARMKEKGSHNDVNKLAHTDSSLIYKLDLATERREHARHKYIQALNEFNDNVKDQYVEEMSSQFMKRQDFEHERITLLLNSFHDFINAVNQQSHSAEPLAAIYSEVLSALAVAKPEVNLDYFSNNFGVAMPSNFPKFEDADDSAAGSGTAAGFTGVLERAAVAGAWWNRRLRHLRSDGQLTVGRGSSKRDFMLRRRSNIESTCSTPNSGFSDLHDKPKSFESIFAQHNAIDSQNSATSKEHYSLQNVYVRAVTDFIATDDSHLGITKGEVIYQLRGDEDGWCFGRIACKEGVYPSDAVQLLRLNIFSL